MYNWEQPDWTEFRYDLQMVEGALYDFAGQTSHIAHMLGSIPGAVKEEVLIDIMVAEAIKTSEIEGEHLHRADLIAVVRNQLGLNEPHRPVHDQRSRGAGELMVDEYKSYADPLTEERLFAWHRMLFIGINRLEVGYWRRKDLPMQVTSGRPGREKIHYIAPPSAGVPAEMDRFIHWFNDSGPGGVKQISSAPVRSAIAHVYFESIHPFEDGNGRIGRAIAEKALSQTLGHPVMLSLSRTIEADRKLYYESLERAQKSNEVSRWLEYFIQIILEAQKQSAQAIDFIVKKSRFFEHHKESLNPCQLKVVKRMLEAGPEGFTGGMNVHKYVAITRVSQEVAANDLQELVERGAMVAEGEGKGMRYGLKV